MCYNTKKYMLIEDSRNIIVYSKDKDGVMSWFLDNNINSEILTLLNDLMT